MCVYGRSKKQSLILLNESSIEKTVSGNEFFWEGRVYASVSIHLKFIMEIIKP